MRIDEKRDITKLKNTKYVFSKNPEKLTEKEKKKLESLAHQNLNTVKAYHIRLKFQDLWKCKTKEEAEEYLKKWYFWITHSKIPQMKKLAILIKRHWKGILNYFHARITNRILEESLE